jgi:glucose-1-phosphate adenylyltransferase
MIVSESGTMRNSILGAGSRVSGMVEDSVLFHHVQVARNAVIRDSVVLPYTVIEEDALIEHALLIGGKDCIVERNARVGGLEQVSNTDFPNILKGGFSVIGRDVTIPRDSRIGSGCVVYGRAERRSHSPLYVEDGTCHMIA